SSCRSRSEKPFLLRREAAHLFSVLGKTIILTLVPPISFAHMTKLGACAVPWHLDCFRERQEFVGRACKVVSREHATADQDSAPDLGQLPPPRHRGLVGVVSWAFASGRMAGR